MLSNLNATEKFLTLTCTIMLATYNTTAFKLNKLLKKEINFSLKNLRSIGNFELILALI